MNKKMKLISLFCFLIVIPLSTFAGEADSTVYHKFSSQQLDEVVVTGTRTPKRLSQSPILTQVISSNEISKGASVSVIEALEDYIPSLTTSPDAMGNNLRIKGLSSRYILILVDGERLVTEGAYGNINLDQIDVNNIDHIEIVDGAYSALYGSNAIGGVINIITKKTKHPFEGNAQYSYESHNTNRARLGFSSALKHVQTQASFFRNSSDGFGSSSNETYLSRYKDYGAEMKLGYRLNELSQVHLSGRYYTHESFNDKNSTDVEHPFTRKMSIAGNASFFSKDKRNNIKFEGNFEKFFNYNVLETKNDNLDKQSSASSLSARAIDAFNMNKKFEMVGGVEYNRCRDFGKEIFGDKQTTKAIQDINVFAQGQYKMLHNLDLILGTRYTYNNQFNSAFSPKVSFMYSLNHLKIRGGIGKAFRAPVARELYYNYYHSEVGVHVIGNANLKPEKGVYSSLSAEYTYGPFNASVSGYYNKIKNKIDTELSIVDREMNFNYVNINKVRLQGIDVTASYLLWKQLVLKGSYSFCDAKDEDTGLQLTSNVKNSATLSALWNGSIFNNPFSVLISGRLSSPKLYQSIETNHGGEQVTSLDKSKKYKIWKIVLTKPFDWSKQHLAITLKMDNIFNFTDKTYCSSGRQYLVGLQYRFM